ncbi:MAG: trigger factor [Bacteroidetes bacterium]|nr:trigger factor [Bacteroidota bacterium]
MQVTINTLSDVKQEATIELVHDELQPHFDQAYAKYRAKVELKGFRKGKAPLAMVKKLYGEAIEHEALDDIANTFYHQAMEERNIQPLGRPSMVDMDFKRGERFQFRIEYEVKPPVELKTYKGIAVERLAHTVSDQEVDEEIQQLRKANSTTSPATTVTDDEHIVTADVQELDEAGTPLIGRKSNGVRFYLSDPSLATEIRDALRSAAVGQPVQVTYESTHGDHSHTVRLAVTPKAIERVHLPEFDETLVKKVTRDAVTSPDAFKISLRDDLQRYWSERAEAKVADDIASEIVRQHEITVPEAFVEALLDSYIEELRGRSRDRSLPAGFDEKKYREERRTQAVWQAKWMMIKERIAEVESLTVTDEDIDVLATEEAARAGLDKEKLLPHYKKSEAVRDRVLSGKIMGFLKQHARIAEKELKEG